MALPCAPIGVAYFDNPSSPRGGWCSSFPVHGPTAIRFDSVGDLLHDVYWVTNLDEATYAQHNFLHLRHCRRGNFLRSTLRTVANEYGLDQRGSDSCCVQLAGLVWRCMLLATTVGFTHGQHVVQESLGHTLRDVMLTALDPSGTSPELSTALAAAHQTDSSCGVPPARSRIVVCRRNRAQHVSEVLGAQVPIGNWRMMDDDELPAASVKRLDWALSSIQPVLVRASVSKINPDYQRLTAFGNSMGGSSATLRQWISQPELVWLSEFAEIKITAAFVAESFGAAPISEAASAALSADFGLPESATFSAPSVGLFLENVLHALAMPVRPRGRVFVSNLHPYAVWFRAIDRAYSFCSAVAMAKAGALVIGYGNGAVRVAVHEGGAQELFSQAAAAQLSVPAALREQARVAAQLERAS